MRFAQGIDRRVGHLRETLFTVIPQRARQVRKKRRWRVVSHAPVRFVPLHQRRKQNFELVFRPARRRGHAFRTLHAHSRRSSRDTDLPHHWHRVARLQRSQPLQDLAITKNSSRRGIRQNHFARSEPLAFCDARLIQVDDSYFGPRDKQPIVCQRVTQRPQSVAIQLRAHKLPVGENQRSWAVPRLAVLGQRRQRSPNIPREQGIILKRGRNHRQHGGIRGKSFQQFQLEAIVEARRIADVFFEKPQPRAGGQLRANLPFFRAQPPAIGNNRVDLAVVRHVPEWLRQMP